jgi:hypothetical protein
MPKFYALASVKDTYLLVASCEIKHATYIVDGVHSADQ